MSAVEIASSVSGPQFDESLSAAARGLHLAPIACGALFTAALLFTWLERRGRSEWARIPVTTIEAAHGPYRASSMVADHLRRAPALVRAAAFFCLGFAHLFAPLILVTLSKYPFDGIAIPLVPGVALVLLNWACGWLLLSRSTHALSAARMGAVGSLMANVGLLGIAGVHFWVVEAQRREGIAHACSSSVTFVVLVFAVASVVQALVTMAALRACARELDWQEHCYDPAHARDAARSAGTRRDAAATHGRAARSLPG
jgi:hypothetical protein